MQTVLKSFANHAILLHLWTNINWDPLYSGSPARTFIFENITFYGVRLIDAGRLFSSSRKSCYHYFSGQKIGFFPSFFIVIVSIVLFYHFSKQHKTCHQRYLLFQEPWSLQKTFFQILLEWFIVVVLVAAIVVAFKLVVGPGDGSVEKHQAHWSQRRCNQSLTLSIYHQAKRVCYLFLLLHFCNHQSSYHRQLLEPSRVVNTRRNWCKVRQAKAEYSFSV